MSPLALAENKKKVQEHYDLVSPYYQTLWGEHIHHGYWETGKESKETAQENLTKLLIWKSEIKNNSKILDVGCGIGGSSIYLAKNLNAEVTGITISPVQVEMAKKSAQRERLNIDFQEMDAENLRLDKKFDVIWSVEALSHLNNQQDFFSQAAKLLEAEGKFAIIDWFYKDGLTEEEKGKFINPIKTGMLIPHVTTMNNYKLYLEQAGFKVTAFEDISKNVSKTWDICLDIIKDPALWRLALSHGKEFVEFLKAFKAMRNGFASKTFVYGLIVAERRNV